MTVARPAPLWVQTREPDNDRLAFADRAPWIALAAMTVMFAAGFAWLSVMRHAAYQTHAFDLGNMDQAVWSVLHGHGFRFTDMAMENRVLMSRLAIHVEPILVLFAPAYLIHEGPVSLLIVQAVIVAFGAVPAYLLARAALHSAWLALAFPAAYLLHPSLQNAVLYDFHAATLSACFLMWALYCAYRDKMPAFASFALLAMATKEEVGLLIATIGLAILIVRRSPVGLLWAGLGIGWFLLSVLWVIPQHNPAGDSPYLQRYAYFGRGMGGIVLGAVRHPAVVFQVLTSAPRLHYAEALLRPLGFLPVLGLPVLILALPTILINTLSSDPHMYSGLYQYNAEIIPFIIAAAILAIAALARAAAASSVVGGRWGSVALCLIVLAASLVESWRHGYTPVSQGYVIPSAGLHQQVEDRVLATIPPQVGVAASSEIEPHLSDRPWIYLLPTVHPLNGPPAQYIVLDASIPSLPTRPHILHRRATWAMHHGYRVVTGDDGVLVLRRGGGSGTIPPRFYHFIFTSASGVRPIHAFWGPLELVGVVAHPRSGALTTSRPDIDVETYWRIGSQRRVPAGARITLYVSPVYGQSRPPYSPEWQSESDSPTWDWLPLTSWPRGRAVRAQLVPVVPRTDKAGRVDVAIGVSGLGPAHAVGVGRQIVGSRTLVRVASVSTGG